MTEQATADQPDADPRIAELTEDLQRLQAEYVNYKRRVDRDRDLARDLATAAALTALLPVLDDLDRAAGHGELVGGFRAVADNLAAATGSLGLVRYGAAGDPFDPELHEALLSATDPSVTEATCRDVVAAGYRLGDRVLRPARVTVASPVD